MQSSCPDMLKINTFSEACIYVLYGLKTTRILRALRIRKFFNLLNNAVDRFLAEMVINIAIMILFSKFYSLYYRNTIISIHFFFLIVYTFSFLFFFFLQLMYTIT